MRLEKVLPALRRGKHARRTSWSSGVYIEQRGESFKLVDGKQERTFTWFASEIVAVDWEVSDGN